MAKQNPLDKLTQRLGTIRPVKFGALAEEAISRSPLQFLPINQIEIDVQRNIRSINPEDPDFHLLTLSIREKGVEQSVCVEPHQGEKPYRLVFGYRRVHAAIAAGVTEVPVIVRKFEDDGERYLAAMIENLHRQDMHAVEIGRSVYLAVQSGIAPSEIMKLNGWNEEKTYRKYYRIGSWSEEVRSFCLSHPTLFNAKFLFNKIKDEVASSEKKLLVFLKEAVTKKPKLVESSDLQNRRTQLSRRIGKPVSLSPAKNGYIRVTLTLNPTQLEKLERVKWGGK